MFRPAALPRYAFLRRASRHLNGAAMHISLSPSVNHIVRISVIVVSIAAAGCAHHKTAGREGTRAALAEPPRFPREYRAAWVATATNIDWPSHRAMPATEQINEIERILDRAEALKL